MHTPTPQPVVYRHLALPVSVFDYIKYYQRAHEIDHGEHLTIAQTISVIVRDHQRNEEREALARLRRPALLRTS